MEKFGLSGLWKHIGSTVIAALLPVADASLEYLKVVELPSWAHAVVGLVSALLLFYKGQQRKQLEALPPAA